jgi:hypothetical protein
MDPTISQNYCIHTYPNSSFEKVICNKVSTKNNCLCDEHQIFIDNFEIIKKSYTYYCTGNINKLLVEHESLFTKESKIVNVTCVYEFIMANKYFLVMHTQFYNEVIEHLNSLEKNGFNSQKYLKMLCPSNDKEDIRIDLDVIHNIEIEI